MKAVRQPGLSIQGFEREMFSILDFWSSIAFDDENKRFFGKVDNQNLADGNAPLGAVVYARILWAFSAAYGHLHREEDKKSADSAWDFIDRNFIDPEFGGVYWALDATGRKLNDRKQVYAIAFAVYAFSEYYKINPQQEVLDKAIDMFHCIESHSFDTQNGGYFEAFSRNWEPIADRRLSAKDQNDHKTMNTHLHIIEAYTNLYRIWPDALLKERIGHLLDVFERYIFDEKTGHLILFHDERWNARSSVQSFGHDIEASWLLCEAAETINNGSLPANIQSLAIRLADAAVGGLNPDGSLLYEFDVIHKKKDTERHWWVQAEAAVGFYNAYLLSGQTNYLAHAENVWRYIQQQIIDPQNGEWFWGRDEHGNVIAGKGKVDFWKCPYHNFRCCLEMSKRLLK